MASLVGSWRRRSKPERLDAYTRLSVYTVLGTAPLISLLAVPGNLQPYAPVLSWVYLAATVLQTAAAIPVAGAGLDRAAGRDRARRAPLVVLAAATLATLLLAAALPSGDDGPGWSVASTALITNLGVALFSLAPQLSGRTIGAASALIAAAVGFVQWRDDRLGTAVLTTASALLYVGGVAVTARVSAWMLAVVWELDEARGVQSRLAVAEERLRFARDLHDTVGRTLSAVAVKSELAAELAVSQPDGAVAQMREVRHLAQDSLQEMRRVVVGYRTADLATELDGARSLLRSAGVRTRVLGDGTDLPPQVQQVLGWVVREAVTNVLRHARASHCTIDLALVGTGTDPAVRPLPPGPGSASAGGAVVRLSITNDGAPAGARSTGGSGLAGLAERLAELDGSLSAWRDGGRYTVQATVPIPAADPVALAARRQP